MANSAADLYSSLVLDAAHVNRRAMEGTLTRALDTEKEHAERIGHMPDDLCIETLEFVHAEPSLDRDFITLEYRSLRTLFEELEATGASLLVRGGAGWRERLAELERAWRPLTAEQKYPLGYEIVYGAAFGPAEPAARRYADPDVIPVAVGSVLKPRPLAIVEGSVA